MKEQAISWKVEKRYINNKFFYLSLFTGVGLGILNAYLDTFVFFVGPGTFLDFLLFSVPVTEAFARSIVLLLFIIFGYLFSKKYYQLEENKMLLEYSLNRSSEAIYWLDQYGDIYYTNQSAAKTLGYTVEELERLNTFDLHKNDKRYSKQRWHDNWRWLQEVDILRFETQHSKKNGDNIKVEIVANLVVHNGIQYFVAFVRDITRRKAKEQKIDTLNKKLEILASIDTLTEIYNRTKFNDFFKQHLAQQKRYNEKITLIMFDIDHFKRINDLYGHKTGDYVLKELASITKKHIRESDIFARWGGEEFVILLPQTDLDEATVVAKKIHSTIENHIFKNAEKITVSIGIDIAKKDDTVESFFLRVDKALYRAKDNGRNCIVTY
ncbi:MAG: GGDEF domain-containing protein [Sulfurimonas sp.]|nr:GGDEF domain-containing protein [Sulfurimonas sp.]